jgi:hypothetical protein
LLFVLSCMCFSPLPPSWFVSIRILTFVSMCCFPTCFLTYVLVMHMIELSQ